MTEESLCRFLRTPGFTVMKVLIPPIPLNVNDRITLVAFKGGPVELLSCDMPTKGNCPNGPILLCCAQDSVLNSKGWKFLNRYRQVRDRLRYIAGRS
jgi:hypothetical protein